MTRRALCLGEISKRCRIYAYILQPVGGEIMGRKRVCIHCRKELRCQACGAPQTPRKNWKRTTLQFSPEQLTEIDTNARKAGVSRAEYIRNMMSRMLDGPDGEDVRSG